MNEKPSNPAPVPPMIPNAPTPTPLGANPDEQAPIPGVIPAAVSLVNCYIEIFQRRAANQPSA